jgi:hypothetical protein
MAAELDLEAVTIALEKIAAGEPISEIEKEMVELLMDQLTPEEDAPEEMPAEGESDAAMTEQNGLDMLALKRKKLALMELIESL